MSHWTKVTTKLSDQEALKKALERLGLEYQEGDFKITQYGTTEKAEIKLDDAVGFSRQEDGTFAMVGDFYHSNNKNLRKFYGNNAGFAREIENAYGIEEAILKLEEQQFHCVENAEGVVGEDGMITMTFER